MLRFYEINHLFKILYKVRYFVSVPDPKGDNKQSACKLSLIFCFCRDKIGTTLFFPPFFPTEATA